MKVTNRLTHIATKLNFETAKTEDQLKAAFEAKGIAGFPAMLDIKERTEEHVQFVSLDDLLAFAKASGVHNPAICSAASESPFSSSDLTTAPKAGGTMVREDFKLGKVCVGAFFMIPFRMPRTRSR